VPLAAPLVERLDWLGNAAASAGPADAGPSVELVLEEQPVFLYDRGAGPDRFDQAIRSARWLPPAAGLRRTLMFVVKDGTLGRAELSVNVDSVERNGLAPGCAAVRSFEPVQITHPARPRENEDGCWLVNALRARNAVTIDGDLAEWGGRSAAWLCVDWASLSPPTRRTMHILSGAHFISYQPWADFKVGFYAGYDAGSLYLAFRVNDDDVAPPAMAARGAAERIEVRIDTDILGDLGTPFGSDDDHVLEIVLQTDGRPRAEWVHADRRRALRAASGRHDRGYTVELAVPLAWLGLAATPAGTAVGLDVLAEDVDYNSGFEGDERLRREHSVLRWAADSMIGALYMHP
jgi:hypothetical protein